MTSFGTRFGTKSGTKCIMRRETANIVRHRPMVSFDVKSLFTSVPIDVACDMVKQRLDDQMEKEDSMVRAKTCMDVVDILILLRLCLNTTYFKANCKFYEQKQGAAMGSPVSVVIANLFMEEMEQRYLYTFPHSVNPISGKGGGGCFYPTPTGFS